MGNQKIRFLPSNIEIEVSPDTTIMQAAVEAGVEVEGPCGGKGTCGKCRVKIVNDGREEWVLACRTPVEGCSMIEIPHAEVSLSRKRNLTETEIVMNIESIIKKRFLTIEPPSLENQATDESRILKALGDSSSYIDLVVLRSLPKVLRQNKHQVTVVLSENRVLTVETGDTTQRIYGMAIDIGTTTLVGSLLNLVTGETLATASATNTQNVFGADVISRIEHVMKNSRGLEQLNHRVVSVINQIIQKVTTAAGVSEQDIYEAVVVGNTTMSHLFLGLDPTYLATSPFIPVSARLVQTEARELGLRVLPTASVYMLPNIAGYVGADTVSVILATGIDKEDGVRIAVDIGTNGEIVLAHNGKLYTCSTAAGPAFEGAQIQFGMRAAAGAIEKVRIADVVDLQIIGDVPAKGICGSGLLDAVAELLRVGVIDPTGRIINPDQADFLPAWLLPRLGCDDRGSHFILGMGDQVQEEPVLLTQKDVRELQLAKGAVRAGIEILLAEANLSLVDIDQILLAGAFGSYINKDSALAIGLLPPISPEKIVSVGNAAGTGAKLALLSNEVRRKAVVVSQQVKHVELSTRLDFQERFMDALGFSEEN